MCGRLGDQQGAVERGLAGVGVAAVGLCRAERLQHLGGERQVADRPGLAGELLEPPLRLGKASGAGGGVGRGQLAARRGHAIAHRGGVRHRKARGQKPGLGAKLHLRQRVGRVDGAVEHALVGAGQLTYKPGEMAAARLEAGQPPLAHDGRLLAAALGPACLLAGADPARRPPVERAGDRGGGARASRPRGRQPSREPAARLVIPHAGEVRAARRPLLRGGRGVDPAAGRHQRDRGGGDGEPPASRARALERGEQRREVGKAIAGVRRQSAAERGDQRARNPGRRTEHAARDVDQDLLGRAAGERALAGQRLPQRHAERELIGSRVDRLAAVLLRRHVGRRADHVARDGDARVQEAESARARGPRRGRGQHLGRGPGRGLGVRVGIVDAVAGAGVVNAAGAGEPEVDDADSAVVADQDVVRLDVAVDQAGGVRGGQPAAGLHEDVDDIAEAALALGPPGGKVAARDPLHGHEDLIADGADVVDGDDVGVRQARRGLRLAQQARACARRRGVGPQQLEREHAVQLRIVRLVDHAHAAAAELPDDAEAVHVHAGNQLDALAGRSPPGHARGAGQAGRAVHGAGLTEPASGDSRLRLAHGHPIAFYAGPWRRFRFSRTLCLRRVPVTSRGASHETRDQPTRAGERGWPARGLSSSCRASSRATNDVISE